MNTTTNGIMTREVTAKYMNISLPTLDRYLHRAENPIPAIRAGRKFLIPIASLERWLQEETERNMSMGANLVKMGSVAKNEQ